MTDDGKTRVSCQLCRRDDLSLTANGRVRSHTANGRRKGPDNPHCGGGSQFPVQNTDIHTHVFTRDGWQGMAGSFCNVDDCGMAEPDDQETPEQPSPVTGVDEPTIPAPGEPADAKSQEDERPTAKEFREAEAVVMSGTATPEEEAAAGSVVDRAVTLGIKPPAQDDGHTHVIRRRSGVLVCLKCEYKPTTEEDLCIDGCRAKKGAATHDPGCPLFDPTATRHAGPNPHRAPLATGLPVQRPAVAQVNADDFLNGTPAPAKTRTKETVPASPTPQATPAMDADDFLNGGGRSSGRSGAPVSNVDADDFLNGDGVPEDDGSPRRGNWFPSRYDGECSQCFDRFWEGDEIRADGEGGWQGRECCGDQEDEDEANGVEASPLASETLLRVNLPVKNGRYHATHPVTGKKASWTRVTNFIKLASDHFALEQWSARMALLGLVKNPKILPKVANVFDGSVPASAVAKEHRDLLNGLVEDAKNAAGYQERAAKGTALHDHTEMVDTGRRKVEDVPEEFRPEVQIYLEALEAAPFEVVPHLVEKSTVCVELGVAGKMDRIYRVTRDCIADLPNRGPVGLKAGEHVIGDVKTGDSLEYALLEIASQEFCYARGVNESGIPVAHGRPPAWRWAKPGESLIDGDDSYMVPIVREDIGVVMHVPYGGGQCTVEWLDLDEGRRNAELCKNIQEMQKPKVNRNVRATWKTFGGARTVEIPVADPTRGFAPPSAAQMADHPSVGATAAADHWRDLMSNVTTQAEASRTYRAAKADMVGQTLLAELEAIGRRTLERVAAQAELDKAAKDRERVDRAAAQAYQEKAQQEAEKTPTLLDEWRGKFAAVTTNAEASKLYHEVKRFADSGWMTQADLKGLVALGKDAIAKAVQKPAEPSPAALGLAEDMRTPAEAAEEGKAFARALEVELAKDVPTTGLGWTEETWIRVFGNVKNKQEASDLRAQALRVGVSKDVLDRCVKAALEYLGLIDIFSHVASKAEASKAYQEAKAAGITGERLDYLVELGKSALVPF